MAAVPTTLVLDDEAWARARTDMTERFLGVSAEEFVRRFNAGAYDVDGDNCVMDVLAYFPELD